MPELIKIELPNAHIVNGKEFPVAFSLEAPESFKKSPEKVAAFLKKLGQSNFLNEALVSHGAIVIRNTGITDPEVISQYIDAIGTSSGDLPFEQNGTTATRTEITNLLCTANEGDPSLYIHQHNEFCRFTQYPSKLFFFCREYGPTVKGGNTPIVHGAELFNNLVKTIPDLVRNLATKGLLYTQTWAETTTNKTSWKDYYCFGRNISKEDNLATAKQKAGNIVRTKVSQDFEWADGNNLLVRQHTKPVRNHVNPFDGKSSPTFFTSLAAYFALSRKQNDKTQLTYDDGETIDEKSLEKFLQASLDLAYEHEWQEGDIAIVDNYQVSHGRCPWSGGSRSILVSMWDTPNKQEYEAWSPLNSGSLKSEGDKILAR